jgi:signal transduction histidine kinase
VSFVSLSPLVLLQIKEISETGKILKIINGPAMPLFGIVSVVLVVSALFIFIRNLRRAKEDQINAYIEILIGTALMFGLIVVFNFVLPAIFENSKYIPLGALFTFPFVIFASYAILKNKLFNVKVISTSSLVFILCVVLFLEIIFADSFSLIIFRSSIFVLVLIFGVGLIRSVIREVEQREKLYQLNIDLAYSMQQRESLIHLVTHKVKGSFTRTKYIFASILDGTFGEINPEVRKYAEQGLDSDNMGIETVDLVLNAANLEKGLIKYNMQTIDFKDVVLKSIEDKKVSAEKKGLKIVNNITDGKYEINGDVFWLKEVCNNLIENSIKYTKEGEIKVGLENKGGKILFSVKDTGVGLAPDDRKVLFTEGGRGKDSVKVNVDSTGYGLYTVKLVVNEHKGRVWAESEGPGKGSQFYIELDAIK